MLRLEKKTKQETKEKKENKSRLYQPAVN